MERWALFLFFLLYFAIGFAWRSWHVWRQAGVNPYVFPSGDDAQGYTARGFRYVLIGLGLYALLQAAWPQTDDLLGRMAWFESHALRLAGWVVLLLSFAWMWVAQSQMGASWRIGIDTERKTELVRHGLFRLSRNPVFLALRASLLGLLMVRPNAATLALALAGELLMQMQVRQEEAFLRQRHGAGYEDYCARTPRWL